MKLKLAGILLILYFLIPGISFAQGDRVVQGTVTSESDGLALPSATVVEVDKTNRIIGATITDINGHFVLRIKNPANNLTFSFIGYIAQTRNIGTNKTINVGMKEEALQLDELVITAEKTHSDGTFTIPQREVSAAVQSINTKSFEGLQVTSIDEALQGRIAGLDVVSNSGDPGSGTTMRIRGATSFTANSQPLIVVNGIPYETEVDPSFDFASSNTESYANMLSINPDDIEEITVLKDASSTAVWGSKGANGVLVIKTKQGRRGPTRVQYSYRLTGAVQPRGLNMLNGDDYTMLMKQAYFNPFQDENAADVRELLYDPAFPEYENFNNNTDWVKEVTQFGINHSHNINVTGGGQRARYRIAGGFDNQTGTLIGQQLKRITSLASLDYTVSDRIKFASELSYTISDNDRNLDNLLGIAYRKMPNVSVYRQDLEGKNTGEFYNISRSSGLHSDQRDLTNPVGLAYLGKNNLKNYRFRPTFRLQYDFLNPEDKMLRYATSVSFDVDNDKTSIFRPREVSNYPWNDPGVNLAESTDAESMTVNVDNNLTWKPNFRNPFHSLLLYTSFQITTGNRASQWISTSNLPSGGFTDATASGYLGGIYTSRYSYRSNGLLFRGHYSYKNRYILDATFRRDGSTKFGENNKYGNFPGISTKWIISDEPFMSFSDKWLSIFAFRASWGKTGNQPGAEYLHFSRLQPYGVYIDMPATRPSTIQLSNLKWETLTAFNYGIDLGFLEDRILFDINFYNSRKDDFLFDNLSIPASSGFNIVPVVNAGTVDIKGWELNLNGNRIINARNLQLDLSFTLSNYINTIIDLRDDILANYNGDFNYDNGSYLSRLQEGNSYGSVYGFRYLGVYQYNDYLPGKQENAPVARDKNGNVFTDEDGTPLPMYFGYGKSNEYEFKGGDAKYDDINHDGNIDELDIVYLGNSNPKFNGGFGTSIRYKKFGCSAFFIFRYGNKIVNMARMYAENMYTLDNQSQAVNWRWRKDGDVTEMPRALYRYGYNWLGSDRFVEDGSFVRLKYLTFFYRVPEPKLKKYKINQLTLSLTMNNLFVLTPYKGVDPEVRYGDLGISADYSATPRSKDAVLSIIVGF